jgi:hypothetical protein
MTIEIEQADQRTANDMVMAKQIGDTLHRAYPGHAWLVHVDGKQGIAIIRNMMLSAQWGYVLRLPEIYSASSLDFDTKRAGGEILERFRMRRGLFDPEQWASLPVDIRGVPVGDKG